MKRFVYMAMLIMALATIANACNCGKPTTPDMIMKLAEKRIEYGDYDKATEYVQRAIKKYGPDNPAAAGCICRLGYCYLMMGQYDTAIMHFNQTLSYEPNNLDAHIYMGRAYMNKYQYAQALEQFRQAIAIDPNVGEMIENNYELYAFLQAHDTGDFREQLNKIIAPHRIPDVQHSKMHEPEPSRVEDSSL